MEKFFLLTILTLGCVESTCTSRRCLVQMLIKKAYVSQPQYDDCTQKVDVPYMEYATLSVDTKNLALNTRIRATMIWSDPDFKWNETLYPYNQAVLPVNKIWTPEINIPNALESTLKHSSQDVLVFSNGTMKHRVMVTAKVDCEVNLFNYPFAGDECPVAIQTWPADGCGTELVLGTLNASDNSHGDWKTDYVSLDKQGENRNFIKVGLSIKPSNPFITLLMPSILIILADFVSFALPLGGGERNSFKVTLVLSFTVFLNILSDRLPGDSQCSPIIRTHFCVCLVMLVLSMLVSMVLTRVADEGGLTFCCCSKGSKNRSRKDNPETSPDVTVFQLNSQDQIMQKLGKFLDGFDMNERKSERNQRLANTLDKIFFWLYITCGSAYFIAMILVMVKYTCRVDHFNFSYF